MNTPVNISPRSVFNELCDDVQPWKFRRERQDNMLTGGTISDGDYIIVRRRDSNNNNNNNNNNDDNAGLERMETESNLRYSTLIPETRVK